MWDNSFFRLFLPSLSPSANSWAAEYLAWQSFLMRDSLEVTARTIIAMYKVQINHILNSAFF